MRVSDEIIQQIKENSDIVDVIGEYVTFKKNGENYLGLCPFHSEKTPSFVVSRKKQIFKCFGCGESGNVISFLMKYRNLNFVESLELLGRNLGIDIKNTNEKDDLQKYYEILVNSARYFYVNLKNNIQIKKYLINRGLSEKIIAQFGLGYAPSTFHSLYDFLIKKGYKVDDLMKIGLISSKNQRYYDKFINRVMFPIFNYSGKVIGFGGRVIDDRMPKYLNSNESVVFKKRSNLYALNFLLKHGTSFDYIIVVEGYMDCISLHNNGITNTVASLGTAFTVEQAKLLSKYTSKIYLCFDMDSAGQKAVLRSFDIFKNFINENILEVYVIEFKNAKDPDEFLNKYGKNKFIDVITGSKTLIQFMFEYYKKTIDITNNYGKKKYLNIAKDIINELNLVDKEYYIKLLSNNLNIREDLVINYVDENLKNKDFEKNFEIEDRFIEKKYVTAERQLLNLMLKKEYLTYILNNNFDESLFSIDTHKKIFKTIVNIHNEKKDVLPFLEKTLNTYEEIKVLTYFKENTTIYDNNNIEYQIDDYIDVLRKKLIGNFKEKITHIIKEYKSDADDDRLIECFSILNMISKLEIQEKLSEAVDLIKSFEV